VEGGAECAFIGRIAFAEERIDAFFRIIDASIDSTGRPEFGIF
jgi:hypothetical protein